MAIPKVYNQSRAGVIFDIFNYGFLGLVSLLMVFPIIYVTAGSFSVSGMIGGFKAFSIDAYRFIFTTNILARSTINSVVITVVGTLINVIVTSITAYALSKKTLKIRDIYLFVVIIFMLFNPGMIPDYIVVSKLKLTDSFLSLWLPTAISSYYMVIMKNFFQQIPASIEESAKIDGCTDMQIFASIVLPISKASLATITLFYAVGHWNSYFSALLYINKIDLWPIQVWLRQIIILSVGGFAGNESLAEFAQVPSDAVKYAVIVLSTLPIIVVYPFLQKYFAKGVMVGSIKG